MKMLSHHHKRQSGASLIEVLVAILILSFGLLSMGAMLAYSIQMPKLSGNRSTAMNIASDLVERIRANPAEFALGTYTTPLTYNATFNPVARNDCNFPNCTSATIAAMDIAAANNAARQFLPAGGIAVSCDVAGCGVPNAVGNLYIVWQEPQTTQLLAPSSTDVCPANNLTGAPRCIYVRFNL